MTVDCDGVGGATGEGEVEVEGVRMSLRVFPFNARIYLKFNARLLTLSPANCTLLQNQQLFQRRGEAWQARRKPS